MVSHFIRKQELGLKVQAEQFPGYGVCAVEHGAVPAMQAPCRGAAWLNWGERIPSIQEACYFWILRLTQIPCELNHLIYEMEKVLLIFLLNEP